MESLNLHIQKAQQTPWKIQETYTKTHYNQPVKSQRKNLSTENKLMDWKNRLLVANGEGEGVEWTGSLGLIDANYCIWRGQKMRSCSLAQGAISSHS